MNKVFSNAAVRLVLMLIGIPLCLWTIRASTLFGMSRMFARYSMATGSTWAAQQAVSLAPSDADSHRILGAVTVGRAPAEALPDIERAISLRPADYTLWVELGMARDQVGDQDGALQAFNEAVKRAPYYAMPYWQRGNLLLRMGQYEPGFSDLNQAAESNPELIPALVDLAWNVSKNDPVLTTNLVRVNTRNAHTELAKLFASKGKPADSLKQLEAVGPISEDVRNDLVSKLIEQQNFAEAYRLWSTTSSEQRQVSGIFDSGFESSLSFDQGGFSWHIPRKLQSVTVSLDSAQPHSGARNLRIQFDGESGTSESPVSQLLLVQPSQRYQINFAARSQDMVSAGLPVIVVSDAGPGTKLLGQSAAISRGTTGWVMMSFEFTTLPTTHAVKLAVQREPCAASPCPIFGTLSLDSFSLAPLK